MPSPTQNKIDEYLQYYESLLKQDYVAIKRKIDVDSALADDKWRYEELPQSLRTEKDGIALDTLNRLVQWKITHGKYRPFLPGMIRKNAPDQVIDQIATANMPLYDVKGYSAEDRAHVRTALVEVCKLNGVGPATGSLVLSVLCPKYVPFFEDQLYMWLFPGHVKLKYDQKEYVQLLEACHEIMSKHDITTEQLEKLAYVLMHESKSETDEAATMRERLTSGDGPQDRNKSSSPTTKQKKTTKPKTTKEEPEKKSKRENIETTEPDTLTRRSKRLKKS